MTCDRTVILSPDQQGLKVATKALIRAFGGQEAASAETGKSQSQLCQYGLTNTPLFAPIDVVATLEDRTHGTAGHPIVTRHMARRQGYALVRLPQAPDGDCDWHRAMGAVSKEVGDIIQRLCEALADGKVTGSEVRAGRVREEIAEAQERLAQLDALAVRALEAGE